MSTKIWLVIREDRYEYCPDQKTPLRAYTTEAAAEKWALEQKGGRPYYYVEEFELFGEEDQP